MEERNQNQKDCACEKTTCGCVVEKASACGCGDGCTCARRCDCRGGCACGSRK